MLRYINYDIFNKNAKDLSGYSKELINIINVLKERLKNIDTYWQSQNKANFDTLVNNTINKMQVDSNKMKRHSNILLGINDEFKSEDLKYAKVMRNDSIDKLETKL